MLTFVAAGVVGFLANDDGAGTLISGALPQTPGFFEAWASGF